jgi:hypothetical protein
MSLLLKICINISSLIITVVGMNFANNHEYREALICVFGLAFLATLYRIEESFD